MKNFEKYFLLSRKENNISLSKIKKVKKRVESNLKQLYLSIRLSIIIKCLPRNLKELFQTKFNDLNIINPLK
jgi:hypothetical protein